MTDRTAAEVMCCPDGCEKDTMPRLRGECHASAFVRLTEIIHAAGYMIVPREPTEEMCNVDWGTPFEVYRAMTVKGELK